MKKSRRNYKREYATYHAKPEQKKARARRNKEARKTPLGDGMDVAHVTSKGKAASGAPKNGKTAKQKPSTNRSFSRMTKDRKKYGKRYI